ncbi:MAG: LemA family protein [Candidatus Omnitrophica bacterium]|nr:LemA family protein [Candidatus Omnitrophota bacterium]
MTLTFVVLLVLVAIVFFWGVGVYNTLVSLRENIKNGWSQIDVQLHRRHDLIPNLVETAKGYLKHESTTLENVIKARQMAVDASSIPDKIQAENFLTSTLRSLFAVSENYPELKASQQMIKVHEEITSTENRIAFARQYYNDEVNRLNTSIQLFPNNFIANTFRFEKAAFFHIDNPDVAKVPQVKF